jgi:membrane protein involved in colicin uptake
VSDPRTTTGRIEELRQLAEELRATFTEERRAIAQLNHGRLEWLAEQKRHACLRLAEIATEGTVPKELKEVFAALQVEARATAMLAATATEAVRALLGQGPADAYDRNARKTAPTQPVRILTTY